MVVIVSEFYVDLKREFLPYYIVIYTLIAILQWQTDNPEIFFAIYILVIVVVLVTIFLEIRLLKKRDYIYNSINILMGSIFFLGYPLILLTHISSPIIYQFDVFSLFIILLLDSKPIVYGRKFINSYKDQNRLKEKGAHFPKTTLITSKQLLVMIILSILLTRVQRTYIIMSILLFLDIVFTLTNRSSDHVDGYVGTTSIYIILTFILTNFSARLFFPDLYDKLLAIIVLVLYYVVHSYFVRDIS